MPRNTPFFKFDSSSWLGGSIQFTSLECKGLFIDLCALYWESNEPIKLNKKFTLRAKVAQGTLTNLVDTLTDLEVIKETEHGIVIPFLDNLRKEREEWLEKCSKAGKKSASSKGTSSNKKGERRKKKEESREEREEIMPEKEERRRRR